jgi:hypothetical protein
MPPQTEFQFSLCFFSARNATGKTFLALEKPKKPLDKTQQNAAFSQSQLHQNLNVV